jgi:hypothetical protein
MNEKDIELKLLAALPIDIGNGLRLHMPTARETFDLGEEYSEMLSVMLFDKNNVEGQSFNEFEDFEVLFMYTFHDENFRLKVKKCMEFFFKDECQFGTPQEDVFFYFGDESKNRKITKYNFPLIQQVIRKANYIADKQEEEFKPANSKAQEMIDLILKNRRNKPKPKETVNLHSIISGLAWRANGINLLNIFDLTIYQIYTGYFTTANIDNYNFTLSGIYSGNVDAKQIDMSEINWAKILDKQ